MAMSSNAQAVGRAHVPFRRDVRLGVVAGLTLTLAGATYWLATVERSAIDDVVRRIDPARVASADLGPSAWVWALVAGVLALAIGTISVRTATLRRSILLSLPLVAIAALAAGRGADTTAARITQPLPDVVPLQAYTSSGRSWLAALLDPNAPSVPAWAVGAVIAAGVVLAASRRPARSQA